MRRPIRRATRGTYYVPLISIFLIIFLFIAYIQLQKYFSPADGTPAAKRITRDLGGKEGEILRAVREGERVRTYVEEAAQIARSQTARDYVCGKPYLNRYMIGNGLCQDTPATFATAAFTQALTAYPSGSLADTFSSPAQEQAADGIILTYSGTRKIPIAGGDIPGETTTASASSAGGTFSGTVADWPTAYPQIVSLFGNRPDVTVSGATKNHPGIDISTNNQAGEKIRSLTDGTATYHQSSSGYDNFIRVQSGNLNWEYMHTRSDGVVPDTGATVQVKKGDIIAQSAPYPASKPHLHLEVWTPQLTIDTATRLWPQHVGTSGVTTPQMSYAVFGSDGRVFIDPVCFFDRAFITNKLATSGTDWAARRAGHSLFEACDAYEQGLGFSKSFSAVGAPSAQASATTTTTTPASTTTESRDAQAQASAPATTASAATSSNAVVRSTYNRLNQQNLIPIVVKAAQDNNIDPAFLLALITQESGGKPDAVSPTGAVGIGQFSGGTAAEKGFSDLFTKVTPCCSGAEARAGTCNTPAVQKCTPQNDDRFDPVKSITASGRLVGGMVRPYTAYDQKEVLMLIAYNAGDNVVTQLLTRAGPNPSWDTMKRIIQNDETITYGNNINPAKKRAEIIDYVETITQQYLPAWGGVTMSGGSATSDIPGFYTVKLRVTIDLTKTAAQVLKNVEPEIAKCQDKTCIKDAVVRVARENGARAQVESLTDVNGCMPAAERAQAYLAEQLAWCKRSPDDACTCPLGSTVEARYSVSPGAVHITSLDGKDVPDTAVKPMEGMSFEQGGDGNSLTNVLVLKSPSNDAKDVADTLASANLVLSIKDGSKIHYTIMPDKDVGVLWKSSQYGGLAFANGQQTDANSCILPSSLKAQAFCLTSPDGSFDPTVFYVDMQAKSEPTGEVKEYEATGTGLVGTLFGIGPEKQYRFFTDKEFPYAKVVITATDGTKREQYFRIAKGTRSGTLAVTSMFGSFTGSSIAGQRVIEEFQGNVVVIEPDASYKILYELRLKLDTGESGKLFMLDDNLREGPSMDLDPDLSAKASGFTFGTDIIEQVVTGGATG